MTPAFEKWLREHVTDAGRRAALAEAADGLVGMYNAERSDLEDVLTISAWPAFARKRFLRAWQALRDAGLAAALAADEGTVVLRPTVETRATQTGDIAAPAPAARAAPEEGHELPSTTLGVQSLGASAGLAGAPRPEITERVRVVAKTNAASPGIAALHYGRTGVVTKRTPAWNYVQLDATRYKRSETIPCRNRDLVLIPRQTPANPELPHALAVLGRGAPGAPGIDDDDDNEDDADANAGTQLDLDVVTDDADGGADEQGLVLAGCNGALFPVSGQVQAASALGGWKKQLLRGHDRLCTTCKATYTSGHFCPTCETRLVAVDQPTPPETNRDDEMAEEAAAPPPARAKASRFTGVRRDKGHWRASIRVRGSPVHLGEFDDEEDAARTYDAARVKYKGAPTVNFPGEAPLASVLAALPALPSPPPAQPAPAPPPPGVIALSSNDDGAELTEAEVRGALQEAGGRMKTMDLLARFKARLKANPANKDAIKRILRAVAVVQDSAGGRVLVLKPPETNREETAEEAAAPPPPPPDTSRDEELARQLAGLPGRARQPTQRFASLEDAGQSYASPKRAADPRRPKATKRPKMAKSPVAASMESSDDEARALATDEAAIREAYAREQAKEGTPGNSALTRRLSTEEEVPRGREKKRCAATRAPADPPPARIEGIARDTTDDDSDAEVLPAAKRVRGSAAATPARPTLPSPAAVPVTPGREATRQVEPDGDDERVLHRINKNRIVI